MTRDITPTIICDTREPKDGGWEPFFTVPTVRATLQTGDYSLLGAEHLISIERKALSDLLGSLTHDRSRFERELARGKGLDFFAVIVEASASDILAGRFGKYGNGCHARAIWESCCCFSVRYRSPFLFASDRITAARLAESLLTKWHRERRKVVDGIEKAARQAERDAS